MNSDRFLGIQTHQPAPMITAVTTNSTCVDRAVTTAHQFRPPYQHPRQVYIILLLREGDHFPNSLSIHIHTTLHSKQFSSASAPIRPQLSSARSFIHHTGNYPLPVLPTTPVVVFCMAHTSITLTVFLCQSFHSIPHTDSHARES